MRAVSAGPSFWPMGIVVAFGLFLAGLAVLIGLAVSSNSDLVERDYYEQDLRHQDQVERVERTQAVVGEVQVALDAPLGRLTIRLPEAHARLGVMGQLHLYRPSAAGLDCRIELRVDEQGCQELDVTDLVPGLWRAKLSWAVMDQEFYFEERLELGGRGKE
jgi:nitrogen fixation protein FixH